ncbi:MAG: mannitol dehydrogenase family protein [Saprospiraceae bacterium]
MKTHRLTQENLGLLSKQITCPTYRRDTISTGIVHIGVGGFHRSHEAYYLNQLHNKYSALDWGICGVGIREADRKMHQVLQRQNGLYTLIVQHPDGKVESEVIGSLVESLLAVDTPDVVIDRMASPDTKIVSLTITEGGYNFDTEGNFNFDNADVLHDLANPSAPKTVFGYLTAALRKRKAEILPPFTLLSCDNIPHNGDVARKMLLAFANRQDPKLALWIAMAMGFPNSMVDRITPVTSQADINYLRSKHQVRDEHPVVCEPYIQWVVEDKFTCGRPLLEKVGVQFVADVTPYEKMKLRLLNAGHSVLGILGAIHGHKTINDCMADPVFAKFMRSFMDLEATPTLSKVEGINLDKYKDSLEQRFANPNIKDSVSRICAESSAKLPVFLLPTLEENLQSGGSIKHAALVIAAWCYYHDRERDEQNAPLEIIDFSQKALSKAAKQTAAKPLSFLSLSETFGPVIDNARFTKAYTEALEEVYGSKGIRSIMEDYIT